jgi:hypothetical protein
MIQGLIQGGAHSDVRVLERKALEALQEHDIK